MFGASPPRRRARDRLTDRDGTRRGELRADPAADALAILLDDDLREAALALADIERLLLAALGALDAPEVDPDVLERIALNPALGPAADGLADTLSGLRRRLLHTAAALRGRREPRVSLP